MHSLCELLLLLFLIYNIYLDLDRQNSSWYVWLIAVFLPLLCWFSLVKKKEKKKKLLVNPKSVKVQINPFDTCMTPYDIDGNTFQEDTTGPPKS